AGTPTRACRLRLLTCPSRTPDRRPRPRRAAQMEPTRVEAAPPTGRILTVPNLVSFARLAGVPLFLYLFLVRHDEGVAVAVLAVGSTSDWVDGYLARRLRQVSRLGTLLDPAVDRLYILATLLAFTVRRL